MASRCLQCRYPGNCRIEDDALSLLTAYAYPGNVRELRSIIQSAVNLSQGSPISEKLLPNQLRKRKPTPRDTLSSKSGKILPLTDVEKNHILDVYDRTGNNKSKTARLLGIGLNTLRRKLESYGVK